jgi:hypothetical protein
MNRLVREHYPVSELPEDLRQGFEGKEEVRVTIDAIMTPTRDESPHRSERGKTLEELFAMRRPSFLTLEQIDEHLRALRDEWD